MNRRRSWINLKPEQKAGRPSIPKLTVARSVDQLQAGIEHHKAGRLADAEACYRFVLAATGDNAGTLGNLGAVLHTQGKIDEAIDVYRRAILINPRVALAYANLGSALVESGKTGAAIEAFQKAVSIESRFTEAYFHLGRALRVERRFDEAIAAYRQAIRLKPAHAPAHCNLGIALYDRGEISQAIVSYRKAISFDAKYAAAHYNLAIALCNLGKLNEAIAAYEQAIAIQPNFPEAHDGLGAALMYNGQLPEALKSIEQAVQLDPTNARYRRGVSILSRCSDSDPRIQEIEGLIAISNSRPVSERVELHFALAQAYEDIARYADAFAQWSTGNSLKRQQVVYDEAATLARLDHTATLFTSESLKQSQSISDQSSLPIFIVGMPRSGTTLIEQIIASHSLVFGAGELPIFGRLAQSIFQKAGGALPTTEDIRNLGLRYLEEIRQRDQTALRITDKMPSNFAFAGLIHLALPNAPIIHVVRDAADTCLSCFSKLFHTQQSYTYDLSELGRYYRHYEKLMAHWRTVLPSNRILEVRYEDVVADLEGQARRIISHCGLEWDPRCLEFHKTDRAVFTASATQVRQPIYQTSIGRWRLYADGLAPLLAELRQPTCPLMNE